MTHPNNRKFRYQWFLTITTGLRSNKGSVWEWDMNVWTVKREPWSKKEIISTEITLENLITNQNKMMYTGHRMKDLKEFLLFPIIQIFIKTSK